MSSTIRWARAVAEALFARDEGPAPSDRIDWLCQDFADFLRHAGPRSETILRGGLFVATWLAPLAIGKRPPLARLSLADRCLALDKTERSPAGLPMLAVKATLCILYYEHPDSLREIGVDPIAMGGEAR